MSRAQIKKYIIKYCLACGRKLSKQEALNAKQQKREIDKNMWDGFVRSPAIIEYRCYECIENKRFASQRKFKKEKL